MSSGYDAGLGVPPRSSLVHGEFAEGPRVWPGTRDLKKACLFAVDGEATEAVRIVLDEKSSTALATRHPPLLLLW